MYTKLMKSRESTECSPNRRHGPNFSKIRLISLEKEAEKSPFSSSSSRFLIKRKHGSKQKLMTSENMKKGPNRGCRSPIIFITKSKKKLGIKSDYIKDKRHFLIRQQNQAEKQGRSSLKLNLLKVKKQPQISISIHDEFQVSPCQSKIEQRKFNFSPEKIKKKKVVYNIMGESSSEDLSQDNESLLSKSRNDIKNILTPQIESILIPCTNYSHPIKVKKNRRRVLGGSLDRYNRYFKIKSSKNCLTNFLVSTPKNGRKKRKGKRKLSKREHQRRFDIHRGRKTPSSIKIIKKAKNTASIHRISQKKGFKRRARTRRKAFKADFRSVCQNVKLHFVNNIKSKTKVKNIRRIKQRSKTLLDGSSFTPLNFGWKASQHHNSKLEPLVCLPTFGEN